MKIKLFILLLALILSNDAFAKKPKSDRSTNIDADESLVESMNKSNFGAMNVALDSQNIKTESLVKKRTHFKDKNEQLLREIKYK